MKIYKDGILVETVSRNDLHNTFSVKNHKPVYQPFYKSMYQRQLQNNKIIFTGTCVIIALFFIYVLGAGIRTQRILDENKQLQAQVQTGLHMAISYDEYSKDLEARLIDLSQRLPKPVRGKVSYYSKSGCLGCNENQVMANGQIFDETKYTLAFNKYPLNSIVKVTNISNGKSINAVVTDRGGFEKYNRIADLSLATCQAVDCKTDKSIIEISY